MSTYLKVISEAGKLSNKMLFFPVLINIPS